MLYFLLCENTPIPINRITKKQSKNRYVFPISCFKRQFPFSYLSSFLSPPAWQIPDCNNNGKFFLLTQQQTNNNSNNNNNATTAIFCDRLLHSSTDQRAAFLLTIQSGLRSFLFLFPDIFAQSLLAVPCTRTLSLSLFAWQFIGPSLIIFDSRKGRYTYYVPIFGRTYVVIKASRYLSVAPPEWQKTWKSHNVV